MMKQQYWLIQRMIHQMDKSQRTYVIELYHPRQVEDKGKVWTVLKLNLTCKHLL